MMKRIRSRRAALAGLLAWAMAAAGGCDNLTFDLTLWVNLSVSPDTASQGATLTITFSNAGEVTVEPESRTFEFVVADASGREVRRIDDPTGAPRLAPGGSVSGAWDQKDGAGAQVPPGRYITTVRYRAGGGIRAKTETFTIG